MAPFFQKNAAYVDSVIELIRARGPLGADDLPDPEGAARRIPGSWIGTVPRMVLEAHFGRGRLAVTERRSNFSRAYDLAERRLPALHYERRPAYEESLRELLLLAARAHGIGTAADLADYYRMPVREARRPLAELLAAGELREVAVEGWREPAYLHARAERPRRVEASALLSPFDPVVWYRPRTARLFGFDYRLEIFLPREKRRWGYYVLPFLLGDRLVARVDLKSDRARRRLCVLAAHLEDRVKPGRWRGANVKPGRDGRLARAEAVAVERRVRFASPAAASAAEPSSADAPHAGSARPGTDRRAAARHGRIRCRPARRPGTPAPRRERSCRTPDRGRPRRSRRARRRARPPSSPPGPAAPRAPPEPPWSARAAESRSRFPWPGTGARLRAGGRRPLSGKARPGR
jgi:uncharacterized protein YcaQ